MLPQTFCGATTLRYYHKYFAVLPQTFCGPTTVRCYHKHFAVLPKTFCGATANIFCRATAYTCVVLPQAFLSGENTGTSTGTSDAVGDIAGNVVGQIVGRRARLTRSVTDVL